MICVEADIGEVVRILASHPKHDRPVRSRTSRASLVAQLLAGAWRSPVPVPLMSAEELGEIAGLLLRSGASALAWRKVRDSCMRTSPAAKQLQQAYRSHSLEAALHEWRLRQVIPVLRSAGAEPVLVKGWAIARLYPEPGLRPYCDLDLCISPDHYAAAVSALNPPEMQGCAVDLHRGFGTFYERQTDDIFARSQLVDLGNLEVRVLGAEDNLRFLCLHLLRHGAVRPLWLTDIAVLLETRPDDFDWDRCFSGSARQADWVACAIGIAHEFLDADVQGIPIARRIRNLPSWLTAPVVKAWGSPAKSPTRVAAYLHHPIRLLRELPNHWPNPIEATMTLQGPFNELPRLPFQVGHVVSRTRAFLSQISHPR